ncbi:MAG: TonB-dependent receptor [Acidobacteria bacterium]|nr:TonB-dependent receptor [Acidobacteriota bacterium]
MKESLTMLHWCRRITLATVALLTLTSLAYGQAITGRLVGTVQDANQGAVPNAKVTVTNQNTGISWELQTDSQGNYIAPSLPSGAYKITIAATGFRQAVASNIGVNVAQTTRVDVTMELGKVEESVEITGAAGLVQSTTSDLGEIVAKQQIQTLPLNGRIFSQLILLVPGAVPAGQGAQVEAASTAGARGAVTASVNGLPFSGTTYYMDGIENRETLNGFISMSPPIEAIEEFKVQTNSASAEYGAFGGGVVNLTLRSGTNAFHGALFEYLRNEALNARDFFASSKNPFKTNQFGGVFGGPIIKNKAFFFGDYQGLRLRGGRPFLASVPTQAMREGRFLASEGFTATIYDPLSNTDPNQRTAFANNQIPAGRMDPVAVKALSLWPLPNRSGAVNNYLENLSQRQDVNQFDIRGDYQFAEWGRLFVRESYSKRDLRVSLRNAPFINTGDNVNSISRDHNAVIGHTYSFTPALLNEFRLGFNRFNTNHFGSDFGVDKNNELGIKNGNLAAFPETSGVANFGITGLTGTGSPGFTDAIRLSNTYQLTENLTWVKSSHTIKFGADVKRIESTLTNPEQNPRGFFNFNTNFTSRGGTGGAAFASFLLGAPDNYGRGIVNTRPALRMFFGGFYVQDDWRVTRKLTVNLGLRYDIFTHPRERYNRQSNIDLKTGKIVLANDDNRGPNIDTFTKNFGPRIGFAYSPDEGRTAVRASFGVGYFPDNFGATGGTLERNYPFFQTFIINASDRFAPSARLSVDGLPGFVSQQLTPTIDPPAGIQLFFVPSNFRQDSVAMWQLSVQRQVFSTGVAEIAYVGNHGYHIFRNRPINIPTSPAAGAIDPRRPYINIFPNTQNITERTGDGSSSYHGLQAKYSKRLSAGLQALVSYTFSKTIDDVSIIWPYDNSLNRGLGTNKAPDVPHLFVGSFLYELPFGKGRQFLSSIPRAADFIIGGWQVNGIINIRSGTPLVVTVATSQLNTTTNNYANLACSSVGRPKTVERWFDTSCFTVPAQFVFGNSGKAHVRGPGVVNFDLSLFKKFAIDEKRAIEFRSEFFNAFNNPHFANPNTSLGNANFGRITGTVLTAREIQLGLKLTF